MTGIGGVIVIIVLLRRIISGAPAGGREAPSWLVLWVVFGTAWLVCGLGFLATRHWGYAIAAAALTPALVPTALARHVTIPLGLPRLSAALHWLARYHWGADIGGGMAVAAVLAVAQQRRPVTTAWRRRYTALLHAPERDLRAARERVQSLKVLGAGGVVAAALLADLDDNATQADQLLRSLAHFDPKIVPRPARQLAAERSAWRVLRGDEDDARADAATIVQRRRDVLATLDGGGSPTIALLQALLDLDLAPEQIGARWRVRWWWLRAPRRRYTRHFIHSRPPGWPAPTAIPVADDEVHPAPAADASAIDRALHLHVVAMRAPSLARASDVAEAWDAGLDSVRERMQRRAVMVGVNADGAVDDFDRLVRDALRSMVEGLDLRDVDVDGLPGRLGAAIDDIRSERMDVIEMTAGAWRDRINSELELAPVDELREWVSLMALADDAAKTGGNGRFLAFETLQWCVCERAVVLWNKRNERRLGNAMFRWLLSEARAVDDTRAIETQEANVRCGP